MADALVTRTVLKDEVVLVRDVESKEDARRRAQSLRVDETQFEQDLQVDEITDIELG
jgi:hypothetical protein